MQTKINLNTLSGGIHINAVHLGHVGTRQLTAS